MTGDFYLTDTTNGKHKMNEQNDEPRDIDIKNTRDNLKNNPDNYPIAYHSAVSHAMLQCENKQITTTFPQIYFSAYYHMERAGIVPDDDKLIAIMEYAIHYA